MIGCGLDVIAMVFIFVPVMIPLVETLGIDPYHFSAIFVLCMGIALLTPPVGIILFMISDMSGAPLLNVIKEVFPFLLVQFGVLAAVMYIPAISTWLPESVVLGTNNKQTQAMESDGCERICVRPVLPGLSESKGVFS